jgi:hypothetical protein
MRLSSARSRRERVGRSRRSGLWNDLGNEAQPPVGSVPGRRQSITAMSTVGLSVERCQKLGSCRTCALLLRLQMAVDGRLGKIRDTFRLNPEHLLHVLFTAQPGTRRILRTISRPSVEFSRAPRLLRRLCCGTITISLGPDCTCWPTGVRCSPSTTPMENCFVQCPEVGGFWSLRIEDVCISHVFCITIPRCIEEGI